jgi:hypothetical protein
VLVHTACLLAALVQQRFPSRTNARDGWIAAKGLGRCCCARLLQLAAASLFAGAWVIRCAEFSVLQWMFEGWIAVQNAAAAAAAAALC